MKSPLFIKIFSGYLAIILVLFLLISLVSFDLIKTQYYHRLSGILDNICRLLEVEISPLVSQGRTDRLSNTIKNLRERAGVRITVIASDGTVLADSDNDPELMERHDDRPEFIIASTNDVGVSVRFSHTLNKDMMYVARAVRVNGQIVYSLRVSRAVNDISLFLGRMRMAILKITIVLVLLALIAAYIVARMLTRPVYELTRTAQRVAGGDLDARVSYRNRDEIGELARYFNMMVDRSRALIEELSRQKDALNLIIANLDEGLIVIDRDSVIVLVNDSFLRLTTITVTPGKPFWEYIRNPELLRFIEEVVNRKKNNRAQLLIGSRHLVCFGFVSPEEDQIVVTLHDVTDIMAMTKMKKDFVTNVSHELRTPLTSIKGFCETALETADKETAYYLNIIDRNTNRLINIVHDLLQLSKLEKETSGLVCEEVDVYLLLDNVLKIFEHRLREKDLTVEFSAEHHDVTIAGDYFKLEQVFINLIDNAIKYSEKGRISVSILPEQDSVAVMIADNGIGIPEQDLPHIFERFYVVDKSRSRQMGGTGLGLSIVKHIVLLHNGRVDVQSSPEGGSVFSVVLPRQQG